MYNRDHISSCKTEFNKDSFLIYRYFLIESVKDIHTLNHKASVMTYGIEATSERLVEDRVEHVYGDKIDCISPDKEKVLGLIELLRSHGVSPLHLIDITGAFVDEWVEDFKTY